jgi:hypothetical protein
MLNPPQRTATRKSFQTTDDWKMLNPSVNGNVTAVLTSIPSDSMIQPKSHLHIMVWRALPS